MNKLLQPGRIIFSLGIIALGVLSLIMQDFIIARPPEWPADMGGKSIWAYGAGALVIACGLAIIGRKEELGASYIIGTLILLSFLIRHLPALIGSTGEGILWSLNAFKTLALAGGAFIVALSFIRQEGKVTAFKYYREILWVSVIFLSYFLIICGFAHFKFDDFVIGFIPAYIPFRPFWAYACGVFLVAGGLGLLIKPVRMQAALLSGIMILGWFLLLHIPRVIAAPNDAGERMGLFESFTFSGILFVLTYVFAKSRG